MLAVYPVGMAIAALCAETARSEVRERRAAAKTGFARNVRKHARHMTYVYR